MADRLTDQDVERRLAALDDLLGRLEQTPGATAAAGLDAVRALTEVYGEALARLMAHLAGVPPARDAAAADDLIGHLLVLHGLHPQPVSERVSRALDGIRPYARSHGGDVELAGITDGVARVRLAGTCDGCPSSASTIELVVREAVLGLAPELTDVQPVRDAAAKTPLIPLSQVRRRPEARAAGWVALPGGALPSGRAAARQIDGERLLAVQVAGTPYAYRDRCPRCAGSLDGAQVTGGVLACPACGARYDLRRAGHAVAGGPPLAPVPLLERDGQLCVALAPAPGGAA